MVSRVTKSSWFAQDSLRFGIENPKAWGVPQSLVNRNSWSPWVLPPHIAAHPSNAQGPLESRISALDIYVPPNSADQ